MRRPFLSTVNRAALVRSYFTHMAVLLVPTLFVLDSAYGSLVLGVYFIVFVLAISNFLRSSQADRSRGLAGLLGCGTILLLLVPYVVIKIVATAA